MKTPALFCALLLSFAATAHAQSTAPAADPDYSYRIDSAVGGGLRVTLTAFHGPFHYRDVALTPQGCSGPTGSPVAGAAEMYVFAQASGPLLAEFSVPMSAGGANCRMHTSLLLKDNDRPPSTNEVDPEMPGQGQKMRMKQLPEITDLSAADPLLLGSTLTYWGASVTVPATQAALRRSGYCYFDYRYLTINAGPGHAEGTSNTLRRGGPNGQLLAIDELPALTPMDAAGSSGRIALPPGLSVVVVDVDAAEYVPETNEANNLRRVIVFVQGSCD